MKLPWRTPTQRAAGEASRTVRLLMIDDDQDEFVLLRESVREFADTDFELEWVDSYAAGLAAIRRGEHDVYLVDYRLGGTSGVDLVREAIAAGCEAPMIMLTGQREREVDMAAMEAGAVDFLVKGRTDPALLERTIRYAIAQAEAKIAAARSLAQVEGLERVGRALATRGPAQETLDAVLELIVDRLSHEAAAIYLMEPAGLDLAAHRGLAEPVSRLDPESGRLARLIVGGTAAFIPRLTVATEGADRDVMELAVPLMNRGQCVGLLAVVSPAAEPISGADYLGVLAVADRLAVGLALAEEHDKLSARVTRMERLVSFARSVTSTLETDRLHDAIVRAAADIVPSDIVLLASRDLLDRDVVRAAVGAPESLGTELQVPQGAPGSLTAERRSVETWHPALRSALDTGVMSVVDLVLARDDMSIGRLLFARGGHRRAFDLEEQEGMRVMAGLAVLALANATSHALVAEASVRDPLTGLLNRRYFDAAMAQLTAERTRQTPAQRAPVAAVLYDLDHFGEVNKKYGHAAGDLMLQGFASALRARSRASDIVARFGGEEFVVILLDATRDAAMGVAEEVRSAFAAFSAPDGSGGTISATVSAGCAELSADQIDVEELIRTADVALSQAKRAGRNLILAA